MWNDPFSHVIFLSLFSSWLFVPTGSFGTFQGRRRIQERQKRAVNRYQANPLAYSQPAYPVNYQQAQKSTLYPSQQSSASAYPTSAASFQNYVTPTGNTVYAPTSNVAAYSPNTIYGSSGQYSPQLGVGGYNAKTTPYNYQATSGSAYAQPVSAAYGQNAAAAAYGASYPAGAYPVNQNQNQYAQAGAYPYQAAASAPAQYNFNGYNPYAPQQQQQQQNYNGNGYNGYNGGQQGRAAYQPPIVVTTPSPEQYALKDFCKAPGREPKCKKNVFDMCDYQDNYPTDVATEFYGFYKSRITAMATDFDYSTSDQYDTGFATQQNKLIDFVHEIFEDNEYGNLPGVPPQRKGLCVGVSDILQPGWAKTSRGKFLVIMNSNNIKQTVRAEVCRNAGKGCQTVPKCYRSECRQRFRYDTLLVLDPCDAKKAPMLELFKIPDGCECFVLTDEPDVISAENSKKNSPAKPAGRSGDFLAAKSATTVKPQTTTITTPSTVLTTTSTTTTTPEPTTATSTSAPVVAPSSSSADAAGIPPRQSLILSPRVIVSTNGFSNPELAAL